MNAKTVLGHVNEALAHLVGVAAGLENKNLADIIESGRVKIAQAMEHPDAGALEVDAPESKPDVEHPTFDPSKMQSGPDPKPDPGEPLPQ